MAVKRLCIQETETEIMVDRLSCLPESLQLHILSFLDTRHAIGTSVLSKSWVSSWTCIPILSFSSYGFQQLHVFDNFVANALSRRQPVKLDRLTFKRGGTCCAKTLEKVLDYAFTQGVEELEAFVEPTKYDFENWNWPIWSSDSLTSLKLQSKYYVSCPFLKPGGAFKNLTNLHLEKVLITDLDPFSGFPVLDKLRLLQCILRTDGNALNVRALQLSEFTLFYYDQDVDHCEFTTPKLRYFEWGGSGFPQLKAHLPVLDTAIINDNGYCRKEEEKIKFDNLLLLFNTLYAAKSLTVSAPVVHLLAVFRVKGCSPFRALKCLKLDFSSRHIHSASNLSLSKTLKRVPSVKAYLRRKSRDVKCTIINAPEIPCSSSQTRRRPIVNAPEIPCSSYQRQEPKQVLRPPKLMVRRRPTRKHVFNETDMIPFYTEDPFYTD